MPGSSMPAAPRTPPDVILKEALHWELLRTRRARETVRSVFRVDARYVVKKFEIPLEARRFRRPCWLAEDDCLRRLAGDGTPRSFGWFEETERRRALPLPPYPPKTLALYGRPLPARAETGGS